MSIYPLFKNRNIIHDRFSTTRGRGNLPRFMDYISQIMEHKEAIDTARDTFSQEQIWPDQCDYVIHRMNPLRKTANKISGAVKSRGGRLLLANHYPLLASVSYFTNQLDILINSVREYRDVNDQRTARKPKHKMVMTSLHGLEASMFDLLNELNRAMMKSKPF